MDAYLGHRIEIQRQGRHSAFAGPEPLGRTDRVTHRCDDVDRGCRVGAGPRREARTRRCPPPPARRPPRRGRGLARRRNPRPGPAPPPADRGRRPDRFAMSPSGAASASGEGPRGRVGGHIGDGAKRVGMQARVPEREGGGMREGRRQGSAAGAGAADRDEGDQPIVHRQRQDARGVVPRHRASAGSPGASPAGTRVAASATTASSAGVGAGHRGVSRQARPSRQDKAVAFRQQDGNRLGAQAGRRFRRHGGRAARRIEAREEREGTRLARLPDRRGGPRRGDRRHDEGADRSGSNGTGRRRPARNAPTGGPVGAWSGIASAAPSPWWSSRASGAPRPGPPGPPRRSAMARPTMPSSARGFEREAKASLGEHGQRPAAGRPEDRRAIGAGVHQRAVDREEARLGLSSCRDRRRGGSEGRRVGRGSARREGRQAARPPPRPRRRRPARRGGE